jgi:(1->4)-alpha-D-glucan 1-alpha-D-glucosylmutase
MTRAGALRIDHVMGLARLFWVLPGMEPAQGTYVRYPFADILGIVALESHRHRCLVIGEDLGTVPDEVRAALHDAGVLSYRLLIFERDSAGHFLPPDRYPAQALAACSTHDLPTLAGLLARAWTCMRAQRSDCFPPMKSASSRFLPGAGTRGVAACART